MNEFSGRAFRDALAAFATGVTIVTASDEADRPVGMTASSFNSVSVDPPLVLWSVAKAALSAAAFKSAKHFSIHVLASHQSDLSNGFARSGADKFGAVDFRVDERGVPILPDVASRFDCSTWAVHEGGDHWIIIGRVERLEATAHEGLVFGGGTYATASPLAAVGGEREDAEASPVENLLFYHVSRLYHQMGEAFHDAVREAGFSVAQWRVLASLHGGAQRTRLDLRRRTFLDREALDDLLTGMAADGLCELDADAVRSTPRGQREVAHLFGLAERQERDALAEIAPDDVARLKAWLARAVEKTTPGS